MVERARAEIIVAFMVLIVSADVSGGTGMVRCGNRRAPSQDPLLDLSTIHNGTFHSVL